MRPMRRRALLAAATLPWWPRIAHGVEYPRIEAPRALQFPGDFGSHPAYRTEWWYVTGWLRAGGEREHGFQVTFFRHRPGVGEDNPSAFAPSQLLFAHAAIADPDIGHLLHDQRAARAGMGLAHASEATTDVKLLDWSFARQADRYRAVVPAREFALDLALAPRVPPWPQGEGGYSRKGPRPEQASLYYSEPQLEVTGRLERGGRGSAVTGRAWLDHEWSSEYLASEASGWDWTGLNLDDGGAIMAFVIRRRAGDALWAGGGLRTATGRTASFGPGDVRFAHRRTWRSPRTGFTYPVETTITLGDRTIELQPLFDDQELDARASTGTVYWEGAVCAIEGPHAIGRGYLELTGYGERLRL